MEVIGRISTTLAALYVAVPKDIVALAMYGILTILAVLWYHGAFLPAPTLKAEVVESFKYVSSEHVGPYHTVGPAFEKLYKDTKSKRTERDGFGVYYDDPSTVPGKLCRCLVGLNIGDGAHYLDTDNIDILSSYLVQTFPRTEVLAYHAPYKNTLSMIISTMRFYTWVNKQKDLMNNPRTIGAFIEIYTPTEVIYAMPLRDDQTDDTVSPALFTPFERK